MFGVPQEQFHQFIDSSSPNNFASTSSITTFDHHVYPSHFLHQLHQQHHQPSSLLLLNKDEDEMKIQESAATTNIGTPLPGQILDPWSNDEVVSLLRTRSSMENWFPDSTWEHVSRKLEEFGFKRSAEKCREKFEEEKRNFNSMSFNKKRFCSELEQLYHGEKTQKQNEKQEDHSIGRPRDSTQLEEEEDGIGNVSIVVPNTKLSELESKEVMRENIAPSAKKIKREKKFEMLKGFCVDIVNKMLAQQEQMHNKLLEDIVTRDEEKIAREDAWKKQEMENFNAEIEIRSHEQAIAGDRQATIIEFLNKFTSNYSWEKGIGLLASYEDVLKLSNTFSSFQSRPYNHIVPQNTDSTCQPNNPTLSNSKPSSTFTPPQMSKNHNLADGVILTQSTIISQRKHERISTSSAMKGRDETGKRWPKDEVLALIDMRCRLHNNHEGQEKEGVGGGTKGSLWERISQGMLELGYQRSAKRCKEKWENINKYFRKTKDVKKKRSVDSRTCPYFQQLSSLYNEGTLVAAADSQDNGSDSWKLEADLPETSFGSDNDQQLLVQ